jgi:hypothetical protein
MRNIIHTLLIIFCCSAISQPIFAQTPQAFNYQGVARDAAGNPISNRNISCMFSISFHGADDLWNTAYQESHSLTTSDFGLFSAKIGTGTPLSDFYHFDQIAWGAPGSYFLELAIDMSGGTSYVPVGAPTQLISVPYALHAATCDEVIGGTNWVENPNNPGTIINANQNTVIITPNDPCCMFYSPDMLNTALVVDAQHKRTGAYFTTNDLSIGASAIKAEIIGTASHSDPVAVRGRAIVTNPELGNGGWGAEFIGGEAGVVCEGEVMGIWARSATGNAGQFDGDVAVSRNLKVSGFAKAQQMHLDKAGVLPPQLNLAKIAVGSSEKFSLTAFQGDENKMEWGYLRASETGGVAYQALSSVDQMGRTALGTNDAGNYALRVQQNGNYGLALTSNGNINSTWEMWVGGTDTLGKKRLQLYAGNNFVGQFNPVTGAYARFSDRKFKSDIRPLQQIMTDVKKLNLVSYKTVQDPSGARQTGIVAQELEQLFPEFVTVGQDREGNEVRAVDYAGLSIVALKAIQEQELRLEKLEKANADLMARLQKLESKR